MMMNSAIDPSGASKPHVGVSGTRVFRISHGDTAFVFTHPVTGVLGCYGSYIKALPRSATIIGIAADKNYVISNGDMGFSALAKLYVSHIAEIANFRRIIFLGWCYGADLALECAASACDMLGIPAGAVAIDPSYDFQSSRVIRAINDGGDDVEKILWHHFVHNICGREFTYLIDTDEFQRLEDDCQRAIFLYGVRHTRTDRPPIKIYQPCPEWQFLVSKSMTHYSAGYTGPSHEFNSTLIIGSRDHEGRVCRLTSRLRAQRSHLLLLDKQPGKLIDRQSAQVAISLIQSLDM